MIEIYKMKSSTRYQPYVSKALFPYEEIVEGYDKMTSTFVRWRRDHDDVKMIKSYRVSVYVADSSGRGIKWKEIIRYNKKKK